MVRCLGNKKINFLQFLKLESKKPMVPLFPGSDESTYSGYPYCLSMCHMGEVLNELFDFSFIR